MRRLFCYLFIYICVGYMCSHFHLTDCSSCRFGTGCQYPCHCANGGVCDEDTGHCPQGCAEECTGADCADGRTAWSGPGCQIGNVAFKKYSTQTMNDPSHPASCATDGSYATCYARPYTRDGTDASWMVDLGGYYVIQAVVIHSVNLRTPSTPAPAPAPQTSADEFPQYIEIVIHNTTFTTTGDTGVDCNYVTKPLNSFPGARANITCGQETVGRFVTLEQSTPRDDSINEMLLVEVEVIGYLLPINVALHKQLMFPSSRGLENISSSLAVDGNTNDAFGSCVNVIVNKSSFAWAVLDLGSTFKVTEVHSVSTNATLQSLKAQIYVNDVGLDDSNPVTDGFCGVVNLARHDDQVCSQTQFGRYAIVQRMIGTHNPYKMSLCEILVVTTPEQVCRARFYGPGCLTDCHCSMDCHKVSGYCPGTCIDNRTGTNCQDCSEGFYGTSCARRCECYNNEPCNSKTGRCERCPYWHITDTCGIRLPHLNVVPILHSVTNQSLIVKFRQWDSQRNSELGNGPVTAYVIKVYSSSMYILEKEVNSSLPEVYQNVYIQELQSETVYNVEVYPILQYKDQKYEGQPTIQVQVRTAATYVFPSALVGTTVTLAVVLVLLCIIIVLYIRLRRNKNYKLADVLYESPGSHDMSYISNDGSLSYHGSLEDMLYDNGQEADDVMKPIEVEELFDYVDRKRSDTAAFLSEFMQFKKGMQYPADIGQLPANGSKNRYLKMQAYDRSRVVLHGVNNGGYINANYISGYENKPREYIACIGPKPTTLGDMWLMIWQENINTIVMLTNLCEGRKTKSEQYWPSSGVAQYGEFTVEIVATQMYACYELHCLMLTKRNESRSVSHYQYTAWPDHGVPQIATPFLSFYSKIKQLEHRTGPLLIHCSAGVGRTGTFIAVDILLQQATSLGFVDVYGCVWKMRTQRMDMVQNVDQYAFIHEALIERLQITDTLISAHEFSTVFEQMSKTDKMGVCVLQQHINILNNDGVLPPMHHVGLDDVNIHKVRHLDLLPESTYRPFLMTPVEGCNDYINAVFVSGFSKKKEYILTQHPLEATIVDFWRLLHDHRSSSVIAVIHDAQDIEEFPVYWSADEPAVYESIKVTLTNVDEDSTPDVCVLDLKITNNKRPNLYPTNVRMWVIKNWPITSHVPANPDALLTVIGQVKSWQRRTDNGPITIQCPYGVSCSGIISGLLYMVEQMECDREVDVYSTVKILRQSNRHLITNLEQYRFLYSSLEKHMKCYGDYANYI